MSNKKQFFAADVTDETAYVNKKWNLRFAFHQIQQTIK